MSAATSTASPRSSSAFDYDTQDLEITGRQWKRGLATDPVLTVSEWANSKRRLSSRSSPEPGPYSTDRTPYMRKIMDALSAYSPYQRVVFMKATQVGASEAGNNWVGYSVEQVPAPFLLVQPTTVLAKRYSKQRIAPMIDSTPSLRELVLPSRARDSGNTVDAKEYPGGILIITGANSAVGLRSMPARFIMADEVDAYPPDVDDEGDPISLAERRSTNFGHRKKIYLVSTPLIKGLSRIEMEYEATDQQRFFVPCPHCGHMQFLRFERLLWTWGDPSSVLYKCERCEAAIEEHHKTEMLAGGEWRATSECRDKTVIGFHINALYSPVGWESWAGIARDWENAQGNDSKIKTFKNTSLGESYQEKGEAPDWKRLYDRKREFRLGDQLPSWVLLLFGGIDVQRNRIEASVYGFGYGGDSCLAEHIIVEGDTAKDETWAQLTACLSRRYAREDGVELMVSKWGLDTGDGATVSEAYAFCRAHRHLVVALKGRAGFAAVPVVGPTWVEVTLRGRKVTKGVQLYGVFVDFFKSETYRHLRLERPTDEDLAKGGDFPDGYIHIPDGVPEEWFKQLTAEQLTIVKSKRRRALQRQEWIKTRDRNEALDCRVYARAIAWLHGVDRWPMKADAPKPSKPAALRSIEPVKLPLPVATPAASAPEAAPVEPPKAEATPATAKPKTKEEILRSIRDKFRRK